MSSLVENFIRRIEKIISSPATVPIAGTDHVNNLWLDTDVYPGELAIQFSNGKLYTSDGENVIQLNRENLILYGLELTKDTSGVLKLTVSSGQALINGVTYLHLSSGTDLLVSPNLNADPQLIFVYAEPSNVTGPTGPLLNISYTSLTGSANEPGGLFSKVTDFENVPVAPADSILLGTVMLYPGATGYDLFPLSVASYGDYYPKFSLSASEFLRSRVLEVSSYELTTLYFPGQFVIDSTSNTAYLSKRTFLSSYTSVTSDITTGNLASLAGATGGTVTNTATSLPGGYDVYKTTVGTQFQFRSLTGGSGIDIVSDPNRLSFSVNYSGIVTSAANVGSGAGIFTSATGSTSQILQLRSLTAGSSNISIGLSGNNIVIDVPSIGTTAQGINLGTFAGASASIYAGMSGADLTFKRLSFGTGITGSETLDTIFISSTGKDNQGVNIGGGVGLIYAGMTGDNLQFRSLTAGSNITITTIGNLIQISSTGGSAGSSVGINIGATGATVGQVYAGMSGSDLTFRSLLSGYGINLTTVGDDIFVSSTLVDGATGATGDQGPQGAQGDVGFQGAQGDFGPTGTDGVQGPQGFQGQGFQGSTGPDGAQGPAGPQAILNAALRYIDLYDSSAGWTVNAGSNLFIPFNTLRYNSDTSLFVTGTATNPAAPNGTTVTLNEVGDYVLMVTVTADVGTVTSGSFIGACEVYNFTTSSVVPGTRFFLNPLFPATNGARQNITATGKAIINVTNPGDEYCIRLVASGHSSAFGIANSSSISIIKLETAMGETGATGPQGGQGFQGFQGFQGPIGFTGSTGETGPQGGIGPQGAQGFQGFQGPIGFTGSTGETGPQGGIGPQGAQGDVGFQGAQGGQGFQGFQGFQGPIGFTGSTGETGPQGGIGPQGPTGPAASFGPFGIADVNGEYTYYATLVLALQAASSGEVVEVFSDFTETTDTVILKDGVNINMNGHTYTFDSASTLNTMTNNNVLLECSIFNGTIIRTGGSNNPYDSAVIETTASTNGITTNILNLIGVTLINLNGTVITANAALTVNGPASIRSNGSFNSAIEVNNIFLNNCEIRNDHDCISGNDIRCNNCQISSQSGIAITGNFIALTNSEITGPDAVQSSTTIFAKNCLIAGFAGYAMYLNDGTANIEQCIMYSETNAAVAINRSAGITTSIFDNSIRTFFSTAISCRVDGGECIIKNNQIFNIDNYGIGVRVANTGTTCKIIGNTIYTSESSPSQIHGILAENDVIDPGNLYLIDNRIDVESADNTSFAIESTVGSAAINYIGNKMKTTSAPPIGVNVIQNQVNTLDNFGNIQI
jgi:hypothetical protein